jgi:anionic cell wall polymer biosynthesis LytR-Cps2A-Psr (LCP) family protein
MTFHINSGRNLLDGKTALMYARSRHSTSDFARSLRQQQIIKAILEKVKENGLSIGKMKTLYSDYAAMVHSNISLEEILGLMKYLDKQPEIISF